MSMLLAGLVFEPMVCGVISYLIGRRSKGVRDQFVQAVTMLELVLALVLLTRQELSLRMDGFCGLGISLQSGDFHALMAVLAASGWFAATMFSPEYFAHIRCRNRYYLFWMMTLGATMGVFLSADLYTTFIFFEIMSFTSYVAVVQTEEEDALKAGGTYLAVAVIGGLVTLTGLFFLYHQLGTLEFAQMAQAAHRADPHMIRLGGILTLVGFGAKAGAFPLHIWLPTAHPAAPAPASAVLSGVITKTGIYGVAVLSTTLFLHDASWGMMLAVIGAVTMVLGAVLAVFSVDLKRTLACSSVSQIGFILIGLSMQCLLGHHNALAVDGTILHILNHSLIKMVLFPSAGIIHLTTHSFQLNEIQGYGRGKVLMGVIMGVPMLSLAGLPLLNGYISKTLLHESIVEYIALAGQDAWFFRTLEGLFLVSGGLTLAYMLKLFVCIFLEKGDPFNDGHRGKGALSRTSAGILLIYIALMAVLGVHPGTTMDAIASFSRAFFHGEAPAHAVHYFSLVNLKGAAISILIGGLVYLLFVRTWLMTKEESGRKIYVDRIPSWCNLEYGLYRPLLKWMVRVLLVVVVFVDRLGFRFLFKVVPATVSEVYQWFHSCFGAFVQVFTGKEYKVPTLEQVVSDSHFARYEDHPKASKGVVNSFAFGLLLTGLGVAFAILFVFFRN